MVTVPAAETLPLFQWKDETGHVQPVAVAHGPDPDPREITDYVIDSSDWPSGRATVHSVLSRNKFSRTCEVCGNGRDTCKGQACIDYFHHVIAVVGKAMCDIRGAGAMGKGVFANQTIPSGSIIGEYLGRLCPLSSQPASDRYIFVINEIAEVTANEFGNITRFVNHHCSPNVTARVAMYGKRQVVLYIAKQEIRSGEQLFIDYGSFYFTRPDNLCKCGNQQGDHLPGDFQANTTGSAAVDSEDVKALHAARKARARRHSKASKKTQTDVAVEDAITYTLPPRKARKIGGEKQNRKQSAASNTLTRTRSARVCKRYTLF